MITILAYRLFKRFSGEDATLVATFSEALIVARDALHRLAPHTPEP
jgi:hypothetical protein